ncbi:MAG: TlpA family protein disulfide reductase [Qingshengfaniella sp.]
MPRRTLPSLVCLALLLATPAVQADTAALEALRDGTLKKLTFSAPKPPVPTPFTDLDGGTHALTDFQGKVVLVNFWATWCAPCREEMPALDALQAQYGGDDFQVLPIATGPNPPAALTRFFTEEGIAHLPLYTDPNQALARAFGVLGLPLTLILDRNGQEVARLIGDAEWDGDSARAIVEGLIAQGG